MRDEKCSEMNKMARPILGQFEVSPYHNGNNALSACRRFFVGLTKSRRAVANQRVMEGEVAALLWVPACARMTGVVLNVCKLDT